MLRKISKNKTTLAKLFRKTPRLRKKLSGEERTYAINTLKKYQSGGGISRFELNKVTKKLLKPGDPISDVHANLIRDELTRSLNRPKRKPFSFLYTKSDQESASHLPDRNHELSGSKRRSPMDMLKSSSRNNTPGKGVSPRATRPPTTPRLAPPSRPSFTSPSRGRFTSTFSGKGR